MRCRIRFCPAGTHKHRAVVRPAARLACCGYLPCCQGASMKALEATFASRRDQLLELLERVCIAIHLMHTPTGAGCLLLPDAHVMRACAVATARPSICQVPALHAASTHTSQRSSLWICLWLPVTRLQQGQCEGVGGVGHNSLACCFLPGKPYSLARAAAGCIAVQMVLQNLQSLRLVTCSPSCGPKSPTSPCIWWRSSQH